MMNAPLILLAPRVTEDSIRIWKAGIDLGWPLQRLPSWRVPMELCRSEREIIIYAEPLFAEAVTDQLDRILLEPPPEWLPTLPERFRKRKVFLSTLSEARLFIEPTFVKPAEGKVFQPGVMTKDGDLPDEGVVDETLPVLCSEPVSFVLEVRCFVVGRQVVTLSPYWRNDQLARGADGEWSFLEGEEGPALAFADSVLSASDVGTPPAFVLDVGLTTEHGWVVIEANPFWGAGLYGCEAAKVLEVMRLAFKKRRDMTDDDWRWTSPRVRRE